MRQLLDLIKFEHHDFKPKSALDFGCGVGRLLIPLARICGQAVGVDVADDMLALARKHIVETNVDASVYGSIPERQFDWVNTFIVLQHIPPLRGYEIIRQLWHATAPNGVFSFHVTIFKEASHFAEIQRDLGRYYYRGTTVELLEAKSSRLLKKAR